METNYNSLWLMLILATCIPPGTGYPSNEPVIGILMENTPADEASICKAQYKVQTSYQSFIEQGGGGVVPIFVNQSYSYYENLISRLNGALLTGGGQNLITSPYGKAAFTIYQLAEQMNDRGIHFPIWGTCLGMQEMTTWPFSPRKDVLSSCADTEIVSFPLNFTSQANTSKLFGSLPPNIRVILETERVTANFHHSCLAMKTYLSEKELLAYYTVLSTNVDGYGKEFVSTMEAKNYPFYGVQWHPEANNYRRSSNNKVPNTHDAALVSQHFGNFVVEEAKRNTNKFKSFPEETRFLANNYQTVFTGTEKMYCLSDKDVPAFD